MCDPATIGAATGVGKLVTGVIGAATSDAPDTGRLKFTPEQELEFIRNSQNIINQASQDIEQTKKIEAAYNKRLNTVDGIIKGTIPSKQALKDLTSAANDIALAFGSPEEAKARGYLTENDYNDLQNLRNMESQSFTDPVLENQLNSEKAAFEQDLARKGVSPAQRLQAMNQFNRIADERRFTRTEELRTGTTSRTLSRLGVQSDLRQQTFGNIQTQIGNALTGAGALASTANARATIGQSMIEGRRVLGEQTNDVFKTIGQAEMSSSTPQFIPNPDRSSPIGMVPNPNYSGANPVVKASQIKNSGINIAQVRKLTGRTY